MKALILIVIAFFSVQVFGDYRDQYKKIKIETFSIKKPKLDQQTLLNRGEEPFVKSKIKTYSFSRVETDNNFASILAFYSLDNTNPGNFPNGRIRFPGKTILQQFLSLLRNKEIELVSFSSCEHWGCSSNAMGIKEIQEDGKTKVTDLLSYLKRINGDKVFCSGETCGNSYEKEKRRFQGQLNSIKFNEIDHLGHGSNSEDRVFHYENENNLDWYEKQSSSF